jgi:hypothetical protein
MPTRIQDDQLKMLMDYTKFHIGMYTTLCTILVGFLGLYREAGAWTVMRPYLFATLLCFVAAGMFGGIVAANLPHCETFEEFERKRLGPFGWPLIPSSTCISLEHLFFWIGIAAALAGLACLMMGR